MATEGIPSLVLDPRNEEELLAQMIQRTRAASNNVLTDYTAGSPLSALAEGQVFATAELLYYLNLLPSAVALEALKQAGVTRRIGTYATGTLTFLLDRTLSTPYFLPEGYQLQQDQFSWVLTEDLYIPPGSIEGRVAIRASQIGTIYNRPAFGVAYQPGLNYVQSVYNAEPILGGSDLEPLRETIARGQLALRSRNALVSKADFESRTQELLGGAFRAKCIPLLTSDKETETLGHAHIFAISYDWLRPSIGTCQDIQATLNDLSFVSSRIWVSPAEIEEIDIEAVLEVDQLSDDLADRCHAAIKQYLTPQYFDMGSPVRIKELEYRLRSVAGVNAITDCTVDRAALDRQMPTIYHHPKIGILTISMVDTDGFVQVYYRGDGQGDPF